ncbi:hypothetical protein [Streptomyces boninensis]|uniref:hypothetical protein n=1 Tax=Streptomyces boninensis TaxID=2039455 RepID=UPI003B224AA8
MIAVLLAATGGAIWYKEHTPADQLAEFCDGALPVDEMLELTDPDKEYADGPKFELDSWHPDRDSSIGESEGLPLSCRTTPSGVSVVVEAADNPFNVYASHTFVGRDDTLPLPLGHGWTGLLADNDPDEDPGEPTVSVLLNCPDWKRSQGSGILVTVSAEGSRSTVARVATVAAERTARRTGCGGEPGGKIDRVAGPAAGEKVAAGEAKGTCAGLRSRSRMRETAAGQAPVESCVLGEDLVLRAYYEPFILGTSENSEYRRPYGEFKKPAGENGFGMWGSARCSGVSKTAVYDISDTENSQRNFVKRPVTAAEHDDLRRFAIRAAERHGCETPVLPKSPRGNRDR